MGPEDIGDRSTWLSLPVPDGHNGWRDVLPAIGRHQSCLMCKASKSRHEAHVLTTTGLLLHNFMVARS